MPLRAVCFVDMPFGKKADLASGIQIDFDSVYENSILPAIEECELEPVRGDRERGGGIIHAPMFGRLLLSDYVIADLTLANPNVFYELGIRHTARPFTTVLIFSPVHALPFDVGPARAIPYTLKKGKLTDGAAAKLKADISARLQQAIRGAAAKDSPLYQLIPGFPKIDLPHDITEMFQEEVKHSGEFRDKLNQARAKPTDKARLEALLELQRSLGNLKVAQSEVLVDLLLSFRDVSAFDQMVQLVAEFPDYLQSNVMVRQQFALALNRRNQAADRDKARNILESLLKEKGADPETYGLLGRIHKDRYKELKAKKSVLASAALDDAIDAYKKGFESDPRDYYPGINAITLLIEKNEADAMKEADKLVPLVSFAVARRGGSASTDYWDLVTVLQVSAVGGDWKTVQSVLPKTLAAANASWKIKTTLDDLVLLKQARTSSGQSVPELDELIAQFQSRYDELCGTEAQKSSVPGNIS